MFTHTMRRKTLLMANLFDNDDGNKPLEFSILYTIERQLPIVWQQKLELELGMLPEESKTVAVKGKEG